MDEDCRKTFDSLVWMRAFKVSDSSSSSSRILPKLFFFLVIISIFSYIFYSLEISININDLVIKPSLPSSLSSSSLLSLSLTKNHTAAAAAETAATVSHEYCSCNNICSTGSNPQKTELHHLVFGIAASSKLWGKRKNYVKLWWRPKKMRGFVWLEKPISDIQKKDSALPPLKISNDTSKFKYQNKNGDRSAIRLSRIVSETFRLGLKDVRWFVLGDDDTFFVPDNLVRVLAKYDHNQFYYIGSSSETHRQNIVFSYNMAFGGAGVAISYPLAKALAEIQDGCLRRYPGLYGSDDRIQACMAELGVPLTREVGFHQFDLIGNVFGLLVAHPVAPLVSLHHLDIIEPIFPRVSQLEALQRLKAPMKLDSAGLAQQSICYDKNRSWTVSVSWGYAVQIYRGIISARVIERPATSFLSWYRSTDPVSFSFNTRPLFIKNDCQTPSVFVLTNALLNPSTNQTATEYIQYPNPDTNCRWRMPNPSSVRRVEVYKKPDPFLWDKAPRRNCCRVMPTKKKDTVVVDVGECREGEIIEV